MEFRVFKSGGTDDKVQVDGAPAEDILREAEKYKIHVHMHYYKEAFLYDTVWNFTTERDEPVNPEDIVLKENLQEIYGFRRPADVMKDGKREVRFDVLLPEKAGEQTVKYDSKVYYDDFYEFNTYYIYSLKKV